MRNYNTAEQLSIFVSLHGKTKSQAGEALLARGNGTAPRRETAVAAQATRDYHPGVSRYMTERPPFPRLRSTPLQFVAADRTNLVTNLPLAGICGRIRVQRVGTPTSGKTCLADHNVIPLSLSQDSKNKDVETEPFGLRVVRHQVHVCLRGHDCNVRGICHRQQTGQGSCVKVAEAEGGHGAPDFKKARRSSAQDTPITSRRKASSMMVTFVPGSRICSIFRAPRNQEKPERWLLWLLSGW